jgi:hypothetical protein
MQWIELSSIRCNGFGAHTCGYNAIAQPRDLRENKIPKIPERGGRAEPAPLSRGFYCLANPLACSIHQNQVGSAHSKDSL